MKAQTATVSAGPQPAPPPARGRTGPADLQEGLKDQPPRPPARCCYRFQDKFPRGARAPPAHPEL